MRRLMLDDTTARMYVLDHAWPRRFPGDVRSWRVAEATLSAARGTSAVTRASAARSIVASATSMKRRLKNRQDSCA